MPNPKGRKTMALYGREEDIAQLRSAIDRLKTLREIGSSSDLTRAIIDLIEEADHKETELAGDCAPGISECDRAIADACKVIVTNARAMAATAAMSRQMADSVASERVTQLEHQLTAETKRAQKAEAALASERQRCERLDDKLHDANKTAMEFRRMADEERERADQFARDLHSLASRLEAKP